MAARWFRVLYAENALRRSLLGPLESLTASSALEELMRFRRGFRGQHVGTDVVVVRWDGPRLILARRLVRSDGAVGPVEVGFELTYRLSLGSGAVTVAEAAEIRGLEVYRAVVRRKPEGVRLFQEVS